MSTDARTTIEHDYQVTAGMITSPGQFQGEPVYTPHFWALFLDGGADDEIGGGLDYYGILIFKITDEDRRLWPELGNTTELRLCQDSYGFVHAEVR